MNAAPEVALAVELAPPLSPQALDPQSLIAKAIDANVPIDTLERLIALRDRLKAEQARADFFAALSAFQGECPLIPKTKTATVQTRTGGSYKYSYAPLEVIIKIVSPILARHGLSYTFDTQLNDTAMICVCTLHHVAGHEESSTFRVPIDKEARMNDAQKEASANTYGNRYAFRNALGILTSDDDDDAQHVGTGPKKEPFAPPRRKDDPDASHQPPKVTYRAEECVEPDESPLTDAELAALDAQDAKDADAEKPVDPPAEPVISAAQVKRLYALIQAACEKRPKAVELLRSALHVKLMQTIGVKEFERIPKRLYNEVCDDWVKNGGPWALKHEQSA